MSQIRYESKYDKALNEAMSLEPGGILQLSVEPEPEPDFGDDRYTKLWPDQYKVHVETKLEESMRIHKIPYSSSHQNVKRCLRRRIKIRGLPFEVMTAHRKILLKKL